MSSLLTLVSGAGLLDAAVKSAAVVLLAVVVAAFLGRASAAWRHLVWCLSVASLLLLPVLSLVLPDWRVAWLPQWTHEQTRLAATGEIELLQADRTEPLVNAAPVLPPSVPVSEKAPHKVSHYLPPATLEATRSPRSAMPWLLIAWSAGGLLSLVPLAIGLAQLAGLHRRSQLIGDRRWQTLLDELRRQLAVRRHVQLRQCNSPLAPLTWGALRPVLLVPFEAGAWPDERRRLVLLHELAHVRRWDWLTQLVAHIACAVYWFNPLVWWAARQMRMERERACDDMVLASGARASDYARELLTLAAGLSDSHFSPLAAMPMARLGPLDDRLRGILDSRRNRAALTRATVCLGALLASAALAPLAMLRAAPPESTKSETISREQGTENREQGVSNSRTAPAELTEPETAEPAQEPANGPRDDLGSVDRQVEEVPDDNGPPALGKPEVKGIWDLTLEEAVGAALANSKVLRNMGGLFLTPVMPESNRKYAAGQDADVTLQNSKAVRGGKVRFVVARTRDDITLADFRSGIRAMLSNVERAYWDLYYYYRNLNAVQAARDGALANWRKIHALSRAGSKGGEAEREAQAREQYFMFRAQVENTLALLYTAESRLRYMMGLAPTDGRLVRPADEPTTKNVRFDWNEVLSEGLNRSVELSDLGKRSDIEKLSDSELELAHVLTNSVRDLNRNYQVSRTTFNRRVKAAEQMEAVQSRYDAGTATLDMLLDAQRRLADAEIAYYRALLDYNIAILQVHYRKNSLLEYHGILLTEGTRPGLNEDEK